MCNAIGGLFVFILFFMPTKAKAALFEEHSTYSVCFTPYQNCTKKIVSQINHARQNVKMQAYHLTSPPIMKALAKAKKRGVIIQIILDKSALNGKQRTLHFLLKNQIPVWIDYQPIIAHNKVIIIDQIFTVTGSFNFTKMAQNGNTENSIIIHDRKLAQTYLKNWNARKQISTPFNNADFSKLSVQFDWLAQLFEKIAVS